MILKTFENARSYSASYRRSCMLHSRWSGSHPVLRVSGYGIWYWEVAWFGLTANCIATAANHCTACLSMILEVVVHFFNAIY